MRMKDRTIFGMAAHELCFRGWREWQLELDFESISRSDTTAVAQTRNATDRLSHVLMRGIRGSGSTEELQTRDNRLFVLSNAFSS